MIKLKINNTTVSGVVNIASSGTVSHILNPQRASVELMAPKQLGWEEWYTNFITGKRSSIQFGGGWGIDPHLSDGFKPFDFGETSYNQYLQKYIRKICGALPSAEGDIAILGTKLIEVSPITSGKFLDKDKKLPIPENNSIVVSLPAHHPHINMMLYDIYLLTWRLYHCLNSIAGRMQIFAPTITRDGKPGISTMGYYLGTYQNYQALIARWNHFAWSNSYTLHIVEAGERASITVGYTNLDCKSLGFSYELDIFYLRTAQEPDTTEEEENNKETPTEKVDPFKYFYKDISDTSTSPDSENNVDGYYNGIWSTRLTIYNQGVESSLDVDKPGLSVTTIYKRNGQEITGSGYEGRSPDGIQEYLPKDTLPDEEVIASPALELDTSVTVIQSGEYIQPEQYYRNVIAIAPCSGTSREFSVQKVAKVFHLFVAQATWSVGGKTFTKRKPFKIAAIVEKS